MNENVKLLPFILFDFGARRRQRESVRIDVDDCDIFYLVALTYFTMNLECVLSWFFPANETLPTV